MNAKQLYSDQNHQQTDFFKTMERTWLCILLSIVLLWDFVPILSILLSFRLDNSFCKIKPLEDSMLFWDVCVQLKHEISNLRLHDRISSEYANKHARV